MRHVLSGMNITLVVIGEVSLCMQAKLNWRCLLHNFTTLILVVATRLLIAVLYKSKAREAGLICDTVMTSSFCCESRKFCVVMVLYLNFFLLEAVLTRQDSIYLKSGTETLPAIKRHHTLP